MYIYSLILCLPDTRKDVSMHACMNVCTYTG